MAAALAMREDGAGDNDLADRLAADPRIALDADRLASLLAAPETGLAERQVAAVVARGRGRRRPSPGCSGLRPGAHLVSGAPVVSSCPTSIRARSATSTTQATTGCCWWPATGSRRSTW